MKKLLLVFIVLCLASTCHAQSVIQKVQIEPLSGGVSFNTITFGYNTGWVTCASVEMRGRKEVSILNTSTTTNVYLTGESGNTVTGIIYPREMVTFKASASLHIYASASSVTIQVWEIR